MAAPIIMKASLKNAQVAETYFDFKSIYVYDFIGEVIVRTLNSISYEITGQLKGPMQNTNEIAPWNFAGNSGHILMG